MDFHDFVSAVSHLGMAAWCLFVGLFLVRQSSHHPRSHRGSIALYALSAVTLYLFSGLYHGIAHTSAETRRVWQLLDQTAIFWLIVGSNLPIAVYLLTPRWRNSILGGMILFAALGTACLWLLPKPPHELLVASYVGLGIVSLIPLREYSRIVGWRGMCWIGWLAFWYLLGAACEGLKWPTLLPGVVGPHELLHICDMLGTVCHVVFLVRFVLPHLHKDRSRGG
jgi:hemolysin III